MSFWLAIYVAGVIEGEMLAENQDRLGCAQEADAVERVVRAQPLDFPAVVVDIVCVARDGGEDI